MFVKALNRLFIWYNWNIEMTANEKEVVLQWYEEHTTIFFDQTITEK